MSKSRGYHQNKCFILFPVRNCTCILGVIGGFNLAVHYHSHGPPSSFLSEEKQQLHKYVQLTLQTSCKLSQGNGEPKANFPQKASIYHVLSIQDKCNSKQHVEVAWQCAFSESTEEKLNKRNIHLVCARMFQISGFTVCSLE